jgi:eukaryotic-like serine/threonine-protein kinase
MPLAQGTRLGPYEITAPLGVGGMGEVYRARDTRLNRTVAIKILPAGLSSDPVRKQRFEREAKTISSLNHPHICVLYDVGHQDGIDYLVMECVEGETLAKRMEKGPLPLEQVLKYGAQIADALDKAHRSGVVHRDLKPGNIVLAATGAKLLDFGLAKPVSSLATVVTLTAATRRASVTEEGAIVGTFQYMSPEQVEGKDVDGRSDIFSLGAVLYEMLTGHKAFSGKSQVSVASAILETEPAPIRGFKPTTPPLLDHAVKKCLAKHPDERWQSASDLASELTWIAESARDASAPPVTFGKNGKWLAWLGFGALLVALATAAIWRYSARPAGVAMLFHAPLRFRVQDLEIAPNGHTLVLVGPRDFGAKNVLWLYELGSSDARILPETEGASYPFWSPDGRSLAFFADGKLKRLELSGGPVEMICDAPSGRGGSWNKDGVIIFAPDAGVGGGLHKVYASGGTSTPISSPDKSRGESSHRWPMFLPDGRHYLYMADTFSGQKSINSIFVGSLDSNEKRFVIEATANAAYAAPGYLLFYRDNTLVAQRFDLRRLALTGEMTAVLTDVHYLAEVRRAAFAVSDRGALVAQTGGGTALSQPVWFDRGGKEVAVLGKPDVYGNVFLSRNGSFVSVDRTDLGSLNTDVWIYELQDGRAKRLTFDPAFDAVPIWSPDGARVVFSSNRQANFDLYVKNSDGTQEEKAIVQDDIGKIPNDWSRDGRFILYTRGTDLWCVTVPELKSSMFLKAASVLTNIQFSPDGKWVAYAANESGKWEIYVTSFPDARGKWQISTGGGEQPRWRGDGKELFYLSPDGEMMAVSVTTGAMFDARAPVTLFRSTPRQPVSTLHRFAYDVSWDGQRFLINSQVKNAETQPMTVILNWDAELKKK